MKNFKKLVLIGLLVTFSANAFATLIRIACSNGEIVNLISNEDDGSDAQVEEIQQAREYLCN